MSTVIKLPNGKWRVQIRRKGFNRVDKVFASEKEARDFSAKEESHFLKKAGEGLLKSGKLDGSITLQEIWDEFCLSIDYLDNRESTRKRYACSAKAFLPEIGAISVQNLDRHDIQLYLNRRALKFSPDTVRNDKAAISTLLSYATRVGYARENVALHYLKIPKIKSRVVRISMDEWHAIEKQAKTMGVVFYGLVRFIFATAMRVGEAVQIKASQVDFIRNQIIIPRENLKNNEPRILDITPGIRPVLKELCLHAKQNGSEWIFWTATHRGPNKGEKVPLKWPQHAFKRCCKDAGVSDKYTFHSIRHEVISRHAETGDYSELDLISVVSGHGSTQSLKPYLHLLPQRARESFIRNTNQLDAIRGYYKPAALKRSDQGTNGDS